MHVLKLVNKRKRSTRMPLLKDGAWISCDLRLGPMTSLPGRRVQACCTRPRPLTPPHVKTVPQSETRRNVKRKGENGMANSNLTKTQNKSSVANKLVDMAMENMYCKIIAFAQFHLYFAILYFCLQNFFSSCNTSFSLKLFIFVYKKHIYIFSITLIFVCKTLFSFAMLQFSCKYIRHCFDSIQCP